MHATGIRLKTVKKLKSEIEFKNAKKTLIRGIVEKGFVFNVDLKALGDVSNSNGILFY